MHRRFYFFLELWWMLSIRLVGKTLPQRLQFRFYKFFYDYESPRYKGIQLIVPYYDKLNLQFLVHSKHLIDWNVFFFGQYEKETNDILFQHIKSGNIVIEAGANNGTETVLLSKIVGETGKVIAFEPIPHIHERLSINLMINQCKNVDAKMFALGEGDGEVSFNILPLNYCNQGMSSRVDSNSKSANTLVTQTNIDSGIDLNPIDHLNLIKMDIQGAEIDLLRGAKKSIDKFKPIIFTEAASDLLSLEMLYDELASFGYKIYLIKIRGQMSLLSRNNLVEGNWLAKI